MMTNAILPPTEAQQRVINDKTRIYSSPRAGKIIYAPFESVAKLMNPARSLRNHQERGLKIFFEYYKMQNEGPITRPFADLTH